MGVLLIALWNLANPIWLKGRTEDSYVTLVTISLNKFLDGKDEYSNFIHIQSMKNVLQ